MGENQEHPYEHSGVQPPLSVVDQVVQEGHVNMVEEHKNDDQEAVARKNHAESDHAGSSGGENRGGSQDFLERVGEVQGSVVELVSTVVRQNGSGQGIGMVTRRSYAENRHASSSGRRRRRRKLIWNGRNYVRPFPETKGTLLDNSVFIPPLPERYNVFAQHQGAHNGTLQPYPTEEERRITVRANIKRMIAYESIGIMYPKKIPAKVDLLGVTDRGTVKLRFKDARNSDTLKDMHEKMRMSFGHYKLVGVDPSVDQEDLSEGLVVFVRPDEMDITKIRAQVKKVEGDVVHVYGVDDGVDYQVPVDRVYYALKSVTDLAPFQVQEFKLIGLENYEDTAKWGPRIQAWLLLAMKNEVLDEVKRITGVNPPTLRWWLDQYSQRDVKEYEFIVTDVSATTQAVELELPEEVLPNVKLNSVIAEVLLREMITSLPEAVLC